MDVWHYRKDDYAFFISPVDPSRVQGYAELIKHPMDLGTMSTKVARGKYRSLEEFTVSNTPPQPCYSGSSPRLPYGPAIQIIKFSHKQFQRNKVARLHGWMEPLQRGHHATQAKLYIFFSFLQTDFRLVVNNAKIFNPPGTIYHTEAERLEAWGLDHIAKASAHVIEYETDWNIDVEQDEDAALNIDEDDDHITTSTPREIEGSQVAASPAPSSVPQQYIRRGPRGPYKKGASAGISEGIDAEGRLPGSKEGVGAFPPGSDWAKMMVALKIKGIVFGAAF